MIRLLLILVAVMAALGIVVWLWMGPQRPAEIGGEAAMQSPWWGEADRLVELDGVTARVRVEGPADADTVLMIHGFSHSLESWDGWAAALSADYRVVRMDLPGHALTGPDPLRRYSVEDTVEFTAALMDRLEIEQAHLVGNSLGGLVAWKLAQDWPQRVSSLVLVAPGGFSINGVTEEPVDVPMGVRFFMTQAPQPLVAGATQILFGDAERMPEGMDARVYQLMREPGVGEALVERLEMFTLPAPEADLRQVRAPTLILWGSEDRMIPFEHAARFEDAMPDARVVRLEGLGHVPHEEAPVLSLEPVRAFLAEQD
ncbi:alpha/beta fold hydrolase [Maricaulis sp. CAU 1757]